MAITALTLYLVISVVLTIWVARTLFANGRVFLVATFGGDQHMADAVNKLLVVGFYLLNIGFVALFVRIFERPDDAVGVIEYLGTKVGIVLLVLGAMHFFNMFNFAKMFRKARRRQEQDAGHRDREDLLAVD